MILRGSLHSQVLEMKTGITVITPEEQSPEPPKVAYLLHGLDAGNGSWSECSMLPAYAKNYNVTFIMPEVGRSYYTDMRYGQKFFTYIVDELPELCGETFRLATGRENTAVMGASMGGYGALKCALTRPERFGTCCAFASGSLFTSEFLKRVAAIGDWKKVAAVFGMQRVDDFYAIYGDALEVREEDELSLVADKAARKPGALPKIYSACGKDDGFLRYNRRFKEYLSGLGYDITYEEWEGGHDWDFFNAALKRALVFCYGEVEAKTFGFTLPDSEE